MSSGNMQNDLTALQDIIIRMTSPHVTIKAGGAVWIDRKQAKQVEISKEINHVLSMYPGTPVEVLVSDYVNFTWGPLHQFIFTAQPIMPQPPQNTAGLGNPHAGQPQVNQQNPVMSLNDMLELVSLRGMVPGMKEKIEELKAQVRELQIELKEATTTLKQKELELASINERKELELKISKLQSESEKKTGGLAGFDLKDEGTRGFITEVLGILKPEKNNNSEAPALFEGADTQKKEYIVAMINDVKTLNHEQLGMLGYIVNHYKDHPEKMASSVEKIQQYQYAVANGGAAMPGEFTTTEE